ncbi:ER membrane protein DP1/Yop1 [Coemansia sp. RSA 988]|nr:ER membrane protein DP1/Yop1 [Coemansia sp. RSA 988]
MEHARQFHDKYYGVVDRSLSSIPAAQTFQDKTGVPKVYGAAGIAGIGLVLVFFNIGASLLVNLTGFGYAAYASMNAIETPGKEDDAQWLTYWVVFGLFNVAEYFTGFLLYWFPFYYMLKLGFLVWLMAPATRGAERLYATGIKPVMAQVKAAQRSAPASTSSSAKAAESKSE